MDADRIAELIKDRDYAKLAYEALGIRNTSGLTHAERAELSVNYDMARVRYFKAQSDLYWELKKQSIPQTN